MGYDFTPLRHMLEPSCLLIPSGSILVERNQFSSAVSTALDTGAPHVDEGATSHSALDSPGGSHWEENHYSVGQH